jgi:hypothetical protein
MNADDDRKPLSGRSPSRPRRLEAAITRSEAYRLRFHQSMLENDRGVVSVPHGRHKLPPENKVGARIPEINA